MHLQGRMPLALEVQLKSQPRCKPNPEPLEKVRKASFVCIRVRPMCARRVHASPVGKAHLSWVNFRCLQRTFFKIFVSLEAARGNSGLASDLAQWLGGPAVRRELGEAARPAAIFYQRGQRAHPVPAKGTCSFARPPAS